ncbi:hypothetical protein LSH36_86g02061 [Paralvinella palmiformis]|uniref:SHSP domain-containing protein n=1 Tax=Paralvinella palmiformis TaxID=53620 RepID=A0AAD9K1D5_9ANNE|nr:hypothetical protein LSH36_86g02061 [Paralvinella palmiformis]
MCMNFTSEMTGGDHDGDEPVTIPMIRDTLTFEGRQEFRLKEVEKKIEDELKRKRKEWEREIQKMRDEFLKLYPDDVVYAGQEPPNDPMVLKRRGSVDLLDIRKMKTMFIETPETGRRFKLRFNCTGFRNVRISADGDIFVIRASRIEEDDKHEMVEKGYIRKIEKPKEVDMRKVKSFLTADGILIVEAMLPPTSLNLRKLSHSPSHSSQSSRGSPRSRSPSSSPRTPIGQKVGIPLFVDVENGMRRLSLIVDIGTCFRPKDVTVAIIKDNRIQVKAKYEEKTSERLSKNKFCREYELQEKIEPFTLRGGLTLSDGRLYVGAVAKGYKDELTVDEAGEWISEEMGINNKKMHHCNVLDLACFPPASVMTSSMTSSMSS